jgi:hypothetical protein
LVMETVPGIMLLLTPAGAMPEARRKLAQEPLLALISGFPWKL